MADNLEPSVNQGRAAGRLGCPVCVAGVVMLPAVLMLFFLIEDQAILWLSVGGLIALQMVIVGYLEAAHVQKRYQPVRA